MSDVVVRVEGVGKRYRIGGKQQGYKTFREAIVRTVRAPMDRFKAHRDNADNTFWALKDVSFEVKRGEVLGIIGRNGAGKSTLLKILSRITEPTEGTVYLKGRVGSLLEVGTGFHPELTGRENIYLSGTILGMTRAEVARKFDEIVDFAGVEQFIDTPVKRYSSGMGLRLGFAVAAHLEPEILVVDEVLAVGDAEFQKKCLGKMGDVAGQGRTVLFVSHNMSAIINICSKGIVFSKGHVDFMGEADAAVNEYLKIGINHLKKGEVFQGSTSQELFIKSAKITNGEQEARSIMTNSPLCLEVTCQIGENSSRVSLAFRIKDLMGNIILTSHFRQFVNMTLPLGETMFSAKIPKLPLNMGTYVISLHLSDGINDIHVVSDAIEFDVIWDNMLSVYYPPDKHWGPIFTPVVWSINRGDM